MSGAGLPKDQIDQMGGLSALDQLMTITELSALDELMTILDGRRGH
jgi:hypothetical protein